MRFIDVARRNALRWPTSLSMALLVGACGPTISLAPQAPASPSSGQATVSAAAARAEAGPVVPAALPAAKAARNWAEWKQRTAERLVAANPSITYMSRAPDVLLAIPVIEIELNADGSVRRLVVLRTPGQAKDTLQLAMDAIKRAAPFGEVSHLPKPWKFTETFLFNDERHFKPRTLDE